MRFRNIFKRIGYLGANVSSVLSINRRNLNYIYPNNQRGDYPLADDKLKTKNLLEKINVPHPATYHAYRYFYQLNDLNLDLSSLDGFVIKPASGRGGNGIKVIVGKDKKHWTDASGNQLSIESIRKHISDIIFGVYSFDVHDAAIIEELIIQDSILQKISPLGLADVRIITCKNKPVIAMLRVPSKASQGKSNLHQGAIGVGVNIENGTTVNAVMNGKVISEHPDTGGSLSNLQIPHWQQVLDICRHVASDMPLKYLGFDIGLSHKGPVILELNVRPGIEIQNANALGMRGILEGSY